VTTVGMAAPVLVAAGGCDASLGAIAGGAVAAVAAGAVEWDGAALSGNVAVVADAQRADILVVVAPGVVATLSPGPGVTIDPCPSVDPARPVARVTLAGARPVEVAVGGCGRGLDVARTALAAELVGVCERVLEVAVEHVSARTQFGRPLGSFQAVKHRLVDAHVGKERARTLVYRAAMVLDDPSSSAAECDLAASLAKAAAGEAALFAAKSAIQLHGAMGTTWEHDAHLFLRRARSSSSLLGDHRESYRRAGALLVAG
jgi:alkylation response protein AidB-like acyl-CoA dehydrogenase